MRCRINGAIARPTAPGGVETYSHHRDKQPADFNNGTCGPTPTSGEHSNITVVNLADRADDSWSFLPGRANFSREILDRG